MKTFSLSLTFAVALSLLFSCKQKPAIEIRESDFLNKSEITVQGIPANVEMPLSVFGMEHIDSLFIVIAEDPKGYVFVYSENWQLLDVFSGKGRARNEFLQRPIVNKTQVFKGADGHILLPLSDMRANVIKLMDITESMANHRAIITDIRDYEFEEETTIVDNINKTETRLMSDFSFLFLDDNIYHTLEITRADFYEILNNPIQYRIRHDTTLIEKPEVLSRMEQFVGPDYKNEFIRTAYRHPKRNLIIEPYMERDYIGFLDLDNNRTYFIHQADSHTFKDEVEIPRQSDGEFFYAQPEWVCFTSALPTEEFFMAFYYGKYGVSPVTPDLMFFDWNGNFIKSVKLSIYTRNNVYNPNTKTLYGIEVQSEEDKLISFDLSSVIDWL